MAGMTMKTTGMTTIEPDWPVDSKIVKAYTTTRLGGVSQGAYSGLNLGGHVGDPDYQQNRQLLKRQLALPNEPCWLEQTHSTQCVRLESDLTRHNVDAAYTATKGTVAVVMTADCLPVLVYDEQSQQVAAIHAGWRGLADGIIEKTLQTMQAKPESTYIWLGPAISQLHFEVGDEVKLYFCKHNNDAAKAFIPSTTPNHWMADLYFLAKQRCQHLGFSHIYGGGFCTYSAPERFYSYRRDGQTGRMASLIWLE